MFLIFLHSLLHFATAGELNPQECAGLFYTPPIFAQSEEYTCGSSSVRSWLQTQGVVMSEQEVTKLIGTTEDGTEASKMVQGFTSAGFAASFKTYMTLNDLQKYLRRGFGVIADMQLEEEGHWVLIIDTRDRVVFMDPWLARTKAVYNSMTRNDFVDAWRGTNGGISTPRAAVVIEPKILPLNQSK